MTNLTRSKKRSKNKKSKKQRGGAFTQEQIQSFGLPEEATNAWSDSNIDYNFFIQAIQQYQNAIQQSTQAIDTFQANYIQNIIDIADKIRQDTPMDVNELMIQIVSPPGSPVSVASSRMNEGGRRRKGRKSRKTRGRKQRGGSLYGTGVGANCFDPNYSIYNTPALSLFPYKPN